METVHKQAQAKPEQNGHAGELAALNQLLGTKLTEEQVYFFALRLCDNHTDRDAEYFARADLERLAALFVGKTGLFDHSWSARDQAARLYRTELEEEPGVVTESGEAGCWLKGYAYLLRTQENESLIAEIEGGIKKEVSVSCAVARSVCSICGNDIHDRSLCSHEKGRLYEGKRCIVRLAEPVDAYEWSFVGGAGPADGGRGEGLGAQGRQPAAGAGLGRPGRRLAEGTGPTGTRSGGRETVSVHPAERSGPAGAAGGLRLARRAAARFDRKAGRGSLGGDEKKPGGEAGPGTGSAGAAAVCTRRGAERRGRRVLCDLSPRKRQQQHQQIGGILT